MKPDFSQPGSDGELQIGFEPTGFKEWQWGVVYTVRPEMLSPLRSGREYRLTAVFRRKIATGEDFTGYGDLYRQATTTAQSRIEELTCADQFRVQSFRIHTWIAGHNWFRHTAGPHDLAGASITMGIACLDPEDTVREGPLPPTPQQLHVPGGSRQVAGSPPAWDEVYNAFDFRDDSTAHPEILMFSYGEFVESHQGILFESIVGRAQQRATFHRNILERRSIADEAPLNIVRREWLFATNPDMAVVHIYIRL